MSKENTEKQSDNRAETRYFRCVRALYYIVNAPTYNRRRENERDRYPKRFKIVLPGFARAALRSTDRILRFGRNVFRYFRQIFFFFHNFDSSTPNYFFYRIKFARNESTRRNYIIIHLPSDKVKRKNAINLDIYVFFAV